MIAVGASTLVALTVGPALMRALRPRGTVTVPRRAAAAYDTVLARVLAAPLPAFAAAGAVVLAGVALIPALGGPVVPAFKDRDLLVHLDGPPGTSQPEMSRIVARAGRELRALPEVDDVGGHVGRAVTGDQVVDVNAAELWVRLDRDADHDAAVAAVRRVVAGYPGLAGDVRTYERQRISDVGTLDDRQATAVGGSGAGELGGRSARPLVVRVFGEDLGVLQRQAARVRDLLADVDGVRRPRVEPLVQQPTVAIEVDLRKAQRFGIKPGDVRRQAATLLSGIVVGDLFDQQKVFEVVVRAVPGARRSVSDVRRLLLDTPDGGHVPLGAVADVRVRPTPQVIQRDASSRRIDVSAAVHGRSLGDVEDEVQRRLEATSFPLEYHAEVIKDATGAGADWLKVLAIAVAALAGILLVLQAAFRNWVLAAVVLAVLPAAVVGCELVALAEGAASLGALAGFVAVGALATRHAIALVAHLDRLQDRGREPLAAALVRRGAGERLVPLLLGTLATAAAMAPFALLGGRPGSELVEPLALAVLGGLVTALPIVAFVVPALYLRVGRRRTARVEDELDELLHRWEPAPAAAVAHGNGTRPPGHVGVGIDAEEGR
jgi:Cu/Ag efflux pump CusA